MMEAAAQKNEWPAYRCPEHGLLLAGHTDSLTCEHGESFAVRTGIPRFVTDEGYTRGFGTQWNRYRRTQLDSYTGMTVTRDRLRRCLGPAWTELDRASVLECGCGAGRFTEVLLARGARVTSVDLSNAVEANAENFPSGPAHRIAQADILRLPFALRQFDVVVCLGVIQHTPRPEETIARLYDQVRPGGWLVLDHYARDAAWFTTLKPLYRFVLRGLSPAVGMRVTEQLVDLFLPLHKMMVPSPFLRLLLARVSPVFHYYGAHPLSDELQREWALLDTHDGLTDWYKHRRSVEEIRRVVGALEAAQDVWCERGGNGVEARCRYAPAN